MNRNDTDLHSAQPEDSALSEQQDSVLFLQIEPQDTIGNILEALQDQDQPLLLALPDNGTALSEEAHFTALWHQLVENRRPPSVHLIIPSHRQKEHALAARYRFAHSSSLEEALGTFPSSAAHKKNAPNVPGSKYADHQSFPPAHYSPDTTSSLQSGKRISLPLFDPRIWLFGNKRPFLFPSFFLLLLVLMSAITLPLMMAPTPSTSASGMPLSVGTISFLSSGQVDPAFTHGYNDRISLNLPNVPTSHAQMAYYAWLLPDPSDHSTAPLLLGTLHVGRNSFVYTSPEHTNLLASYSGVRITEQSANATPSAPSQDPRTRRWDGFISTIPTPGDENHYSLLSHLRHLIAQDPTLQANGLSGGLALWMTRNASKVNEWSSAAQGQWHGAHTSANDAALIHRHLARILEVLDGQFYYGRDVPSGSAVQIDPQMVKIGLIESIPNQNPPAYLEHVNLHLTGLANSPGHTQEQQRLALVVDTAVMRMEKDLQQVRKDAATLIRMNADQLRQSETPSTLDEMSTLTTEVTSGWLDPNTGENTGGVVWLNARLQRLATISISQSKQRN